MNQASLETEEDLQLVKEYILLPILLDVLERDMTVIGEVKLKLGFIYEKTLRQAQDRIIADVSMLRRNLREQGIKVYELKRTNLSVEARYLCRGYHHDFSMLWGLVKAELYKYLSVYLHIDLRSSL